MTTPTVKKESIRVQLMNAITKNKKPMTLEQLYKVVADKPKATIRGTLNGNVDKHFIRVSPGTYDLFSNKKTAGKKPTATPATTTKPKAAGKKPAATPATATKPKAATAKTSPSTGAKATADNKPAQTATKATTAKK